MNARIALVSAVCLSPWLAGCEPPSSPPPPPARVPVVSELIETSAFRGVVTVLGRLEPAVSVEVRALEAGRISYAQRFAGGLRTGEHVVRGELLFELDNDTLRLERVEAEVGVRAAEAELERARRGVDGGFLSQAELTRRQLEAELAHETLESRRWRSERLQHRAAISGVLSVSKEVPPGSELAAGFVLAELAGEEALEVEAWATAASLERLRPGLEVRYRRPGVEGVVGEGTISEMARRVDAAGTARLVATVSADLGLPAIGEGLEVDILLAELGNVITVPEVALISHTGVASVFVLEPLGADYQARQRLVQPGVRGDGRVVILEGLLAGERVAVAGAELLADGLLAAEAESQGEPECCAD